MATVNLGRIKPVFRGAYNNSTAYVVDDIVTSGNETFICISASTGNATSNGTFWTKLAAKGADGTDVGTTLTTQGDILYRDGSGLQRLAAGTSGQALLTQGSGANPIWGSAGGIKQVIQTVKTSAQTINSLSNVDIMSVSITPSSTSSKILVSWNINACSNDHGELNIFRDATQIYLGDASGTLSRSAHGMYALQGDHINEFSGTYLDSPSTTSAITYYAKGRCPGLASHSVYINRPDDGSVRPQNHRLASNIMVMEVTV
jgi:hypothetical protein